MSATAAQNRHFPTGLFRGFGKGLNVNLHSPAHQLRDGPVALLGNPFELVEMWLGELNLGSKHDVNTTSPTTCHQSRRCGWGYRERLIREEITSLESISDLGKLELLVLSLPDRVGSPLSLNALREDLQVSHQTVARWTDILERVYGIFRIAPFGAAKLRAVKKERKHYHYDWSVVTNPGARFENLVASHLLKWVEFQIDTEGRPLELRYFRDTDGREVDFVVTENAKAIALVECKLGDDTVSPGLKYMKARFPEAQAWQVSATGTRDFVDAQGIRVAPAVTLLRQLA